MEWKLEVVIVPVTDVDRAKHFYSEQVGFNVDVDHQASEAFRIVQLTPPGSGCSIVIGIGVGAKESPPGSLQGVQLVVDDIEAARAQLVERGVDASPIKNFTDGEWREGKGGDWNSFVTFNDPDGNGWVVQERPASARAN